MRDYAYIIPMITLPLNQSPILYLLYYHTRDISRVYIYNTINTREVSRACQLKRTTILVGIL